MDHGGCFTRWSLVCLPKRGLIWMIFGILLWSILISWTAQAAERNKVAGGLDGSAGISWSFNGEWIALTGYEGTLRMAKVLLINPVTGVQRFLPAGNRLSAEPVWSPKENWLAFTSGTPSTQGNAVFTSLPDGSRSYQVTSQQSVYGDISWSPDGRRVAFTEFVSQATGQKASRLHVADRDGAGWKVLAQVAGTIQGPAEWSPDGRRLVLEVSQSGLGSDIHLVDAATGRIQPVAATVENERSPEWSPDGRRIAYTASNVYLVDPEGTNRQRIAGVYAQDDPFWSPTGEEVFIPTDPNSGGIVAVNSRTLAIRRLNTGTYSYWLKPSPDGKKIAYSVSGSREPNQDGVYVIKSDGSGKERVFESPAQYAWAPDSRRLAVLAPDNRGRYDLLLITPDAAASGGLSGGINIEFDLGGGSKITIFGSLGSGNVDLTARLTLNGTNLKLWIINQGASAVGKEFQVDLMADGTKIATLWRTWQMAAGEQWLTEFNLQGLPTPRTITVDVDPQGTSGDVNRGNNRVTLQTR